MRDEPVHCGIIAIDIEGSNRPGWTDPIRTRLRARLHRLVDQALAQADIDPALTTPRDTGDGMLLLVQPKISTARLLNPLATSLASALITDNQEAPTAERMRLRVVVHAGYLLADAHGHTGTSLNHAFRLLDAEIVRGVLAGSPTATVLIVVAEEIYQGIVRHAYQGIDPAAWQPLDLAAKETSTRAWIHFPGLARQPELPAKSPSPQDAQTSAIGRPIANLPPRNPHFTGRIDLLTDLDQHLATGNPTAIVAVGGLGGIGKTQVALEYAYQHLNELRLAWWIPAETPLAAATALADLAPHLQLPVATELEPTVASVLGWLRRHPDWLLIFDNADHLEQLRGYLPAPGYGRVVITSRDPAFAQLAHPLSVDPLSHEEAVAYLLRRTGNPDTPAADELARELGGLPLALAQAGAYIAETGQTLTGYLARYRIAARHMLADPAFAPADHPVSVAATWQLARQQAILQQPAAGELLELWAFLDPNAIPVDLVAVKPDILPADLATMVADGVALDHAVGALHRVGLLSVAGEGRVRVHRLVQALTRTSLTSQQAAGWAARAVALVLAAFPDEPGPGDVSDWPQAAGLLAHAQTVLAHAEEHEVALADIAGLCHRVGVYLRARAEYSAARVMLERALKIKETAYGPDHAEVAVTLTNLGYVLDELGELEAARQRLERALAIKETAYGPDHPSVAITLTNLGFVLDDLGEWAVARRMLERALNIKEAAYGPDHPQVARTLNILGWVLRRLGEFSAARRIMERALTVFEKAYGTDHPQVAISLGILGRVLRDLGEYSAARRMLERALNIKEAAYGPDHPEVARTLTSLGIVLNGLGEFPVARQLLERALAIEEAAFSPDHPEVAVTLTSLGEVLGNLEKFSAARRMLERALNIKEAAYGPDHPRVAVNLTSLGDVLHRIGELPVARQLLERALRIKEAAYGPDHPEIATTLTSLGEVLYSLGDSSAAREQFQRALTICRATLGDQHPDTQRFAEFLNRSPT